MGEGGTWGLSLTPDLPDLQKRNLAVKYKFINTRLNRNEFPFSPDFTLFNIKLYLLNNFFHDEHFCIIKREILDMSTMSLRNKNIS